MKRIGVALLAITLGACAKSSLRVHCTADTDCLRGTIRGVCVPNENACAFKDASCPTGYRYDPTASSNAGSCVLFSGGDDLAMSDIAMNVADSSTPFADIAASGDTAPSNGAWTPEATFPGKRLLGVWGSERNDVYAVASKDIFHSVGDGRWTSIRSLPSDKLWSYDAIWVDAKNPKHVYAVGDSTIDHSSDSGATWNSEWPSSQLVSLHAIAGNAYNYLFVVGKQVWSQDGGGWKQIQQTGAPLFTCATWELGLGTIYVAGAFDGNVYKSDINGAFTKVYNTGWPNIRGVFGSGDYYIVGPGGRIAHGDRDNNWGMPEQHSNTSKDLSSVYGAGANAYYAVGAAGTILFSTGDGNWTLQDGNTTADLTAVWASGSDDIYAVGSDANGGVVMHLRR